jgi:hypothetical protein
MPANARHMCAHMMRLTDPLMVTPSCADLGGVGPSHLSHITVCVPAAVRPTRVHPIRARRQLLLVQSGRR